MNKHGLADKKRLLIVRLAQIGVLKSSSIIRALEEVDRADFVPKDLQSLVYEDTPLPIGGGQTISQPYTVVFMLEQLLVEEGGVVLEIGYGSCWQTALLAHLVGSAGRVYAFERLPFLCAWGKDNLQAYPDLARRVRLFCKSGEQGYPEEAPFDRIIAAAEVAKVPPAWRTQLGSQGRLVYPKDGTLVVETKKKDGSFETAVFPGFVFVPFVEEY